MIDAFSVDALSRSSASGKPALNAFRSPVVGNAALVKLLDRMAAFHSGAGLDAQLAETGRRTLDLTTLAAPTAQPVGAVKWN